MIEPPLALNGLLPKVLSPTHYLKKAGIMPSKKKSAVAQDDIAARDAEAMAQGRAILMSATAVAVVLLVMTGNRK